MVLMLMTSPCMPCGNNSSGTTEFEVQVVAFDFAIGCGIGVKVDTLLFMKAKNSMVCGGT